MATSKDQFELVLEQLTWQLRREHQNEIEALKATIDRLEGGRDKRQSAPDLDGEGASVDPVPSGEDGDVQYESERNLAGWLDGSPAYDSADSLKTQMGPAGGNGKRRLGRMGTGALLREAIDASTNKQRSRRLSLSAVPHHRAVAMSSNRCLRLVEQVVRSHYFEATFSLLIAVNAVVMIWEAQLLGEGVAADLGGNPQQAADRGSPKAFEVVGMAFGIAFTVELVLRLIGLRLQFALELWNWIDLAIVVSWFVGMMERSIPINPQLLRLARLAKLIRMLRLVRLVKQMQGFDSLYLMTTSLKGSFSILGWTTCVLLVVLVLNALLLNRLLAEFYFLEGRFPLSERRELFRYFGSFTTSLFSMFELTLANWPPISRMLYENVSEWFILMAIVHKLTIGFAVIGIINGVFIQETFKVAQLDDELMYRRGQLSRRVHAEKIRRLVVTADASADGELDIDEFRGIFENPALQAWLSSMELVPSDVDLLFRMMDDGRNGTLSVDEMIRGVAKFKGSARNIDLHTLLNEHRELHALMRQFLADQHLHTISRV